MTPAACGSASVYCVGNVQYSVPSGSFSTPEAQPATTRTGMSTCPLGFWCSNGVRTACAAGSFGGTTGLSTSVCSGQCSAGFYCAGTNNTSPTATPCGSAAFYCPLGSPGATPVSAGFYSVASSSQTQCEAGSYCAAGVRALCDPGRYSSALGATAACSPLAS